MFELALGPLIESGKEREKAVSAAGSLLSNQVVQACASEPFHVVFRVYM